VLELGGAAVAVLVVETAGVGVVVGGGVLVADAHAVVVEPVDDGARLQVESSLKMKRRLGFWWSLSTSVLFRLST